MDTAQTLVRMMSETAQKAAKDREPSVCVGTVTGVNPLRVKIGDAYEIDESFMRIGALCRRNVIKIPTNESVKHLHEINAETENAMTGITFAGSGTLTETPPGHKHSIKIKTETALPEILLWRGVRAGDSVLVIRFQGGSLHYIMERLDGLSNDGSETKGDETIDNPEKEEQL